MRHRPRARYALIVTLAGALLAGASAPEGTVNLTVTGLRSAKGQVLVCLTREADRFPDCSGSTTARSAIMPASRPQTTFTDLPQGRYAISVLHDENANGRADKTLGLIPREGFGFSRDAPLRMGPPKFSAAAFTVGEEPMQMAIRMRYLF